MKPLGSTCFRKVSQVPVDVVGTVPICASLQSGRVGIFVTGPNTLTYRSAPVNGLPLNGGTFGLFVGVTGVPTAFTTAIVGVPPVACVGSVMFPLFQLSKYRKMPFLAQGVSTWGFCVVLALTI